MKNAIRPVKYLSSLVLVVVGLMSWVILQGRLARPVSENHLLFPLSPLRQAQDTALSDSSLSELKMTIQARWVKTYGKLPLSFEANQGQIDSQVKFLSRGSNYTLFLTSTEAVLVLRRAGRRIQMDDEPWMTNHRPSSLVPRPSFTDTVLHMKLMGANSKPGGRLR